MTEEINNAGKMLVIGGKSGIGKSIRERFNADSASRTNGFDINQNIIAVLDDYLNMYDTIVLSAYGDFGSQIKALFQLCNAFPKNKLIIVIGSMGAYNYQAKDLKRWSYMVEKKAISEAAVGLVKMGHSVSCIQPDVVDTEYNKHKKVPKLTTSNITDIVDFIIDNFNMGILIENINIQTFQAPSMEREFGLVGAPDA